MGDEQRESVLVRGGSLVDEMDVQAIDFGDELSESVERGFTRPPVVSARPVFGQFPGVTQRDALAPVRYAFSFRPTGL